MNYRKTFIETLHIKHNGFFKRFFNKKITIIYQEASIREYDEFIESIQENNHIGFCIDFLKNRGLKINDIDVILSNNFDIFFRNLLKNFLALDEKVIDKFFEKENKDKTEDLEILKEENKKNKALMEGYFVNIGFNIFDLYEKITYGQFNHMYKSAIYYKGIDTFNSLDKETQSKNQSYKEDLDRMIIGEIQITEEEQKRIEMFFNQY